MAAEPLYTSKLGRDLQRLGSRELEIGDFRLTTAKHGHILDVYLHGNKHTAQVSTQDGLLRKHVVSVTEYGSDNARHVALPAFARDSLRSLIRAMAAILTNIAPDLDYKHKENEARGAAEPGARDLHQELDLFGLGIRFFGGYKFSRRRSGRNFFVFLQNTGTGANATAEIGEKKVFLDAKGKRPDGSYNVKTETLTLDKVTSVRQLAGRMLALIRKCESEKATAAAEPEAVRIDPERCGPAAYQLAKLVALVLRPEQQRKLTVAGVSFTVTSIIRSSGSDYDRRWLKELLNQEDKGYRTRHGVQLDLGADGFIRLYTMPGSKTLEVSYDSRWKHISTANIKCSGHEKLTEILTKVLHVTGVSSRTHKSTTVPTHIQQKFVSDFTHGFKYAVLNNIADVNHPNYDESEGTPYLIDRANPDDFDAAADRFLEAIGERIITGIWRILPEHLRNRKDIASALEGSDFGNYVCISNTGAGVSLDDYYRPQDSELRDLVDEFSDITHTAASGIPYVDAEFRDGRVHLSTTTMHVHGAAEPATPSIAFNPNTTATEVLHNIKPGQGASLTVSGKHVLVQVIKSNPEYNTVDMRVRGIPGLTWVNLAVARKNRSFISIRYNRDPANTHGYYGGSAGAVDVKKVDSATAFLLKVLGLAYRSLHLKHDAPQHYVDGVINSYIGTSLELTVDDTREDYNANNGEGTDLSEFFYAGDVDADGHKKVQDLVQRFLASAWPAIESNLPADRVNLSAEHVGHALLLSAGGWALAFAETRYRADVDEDLGEFLEACTEHLGELTPYRVNDRVFSFQ